MSDQKIAREEIESRLCEIIADSLDLDVEDVRPESKLSEDLDADSLDVLDVSYRVDRQFGFTLPVLDLGRRLRESPEEWLDQEGALTDVGLKSLLGIAPELSRLGLAEGDSLVTIFERLTVGDLIEMIANHDGSGEKRAEEPISTSAEA